MEKMHANSFRDLIVYQKAKSVSRLIFELSKKDFVTNIGANEDYFVIYDHLKSKSSQLVLLKEAEY